MYQRAASRRPVRCLLEQIRAGLLIMHISARDEPTLAAEERLLEEVRVRALERRERGCLGRGDERGEE